jgi:hypothetical protein
MSLRDQINKQSILLDNERERANSLSITLQETEKLLKSKEKELARLNEIEIDYKNLTERFNKLQSALDRLKDYHSYFEHFSYVCSLCHKVNVVSTYNTQIEYRAECNYCGDVNLFSFNFDYIYFLTSNHSDLLKIGYSKSNPLEALTEINSKKDSIPWRLSAYHKTFTGKELIEAVHRTLNGFKVENKNLLNISLFEVRNILMKDHGLKIIRIEEGNQ